MSQRIQHTAVYLGPQQDAAQGAASATGLSAGGDRRDSYWAAHHKRRQMFIGGSTAIVITGAKFFPGFGDWYLAKTGYDSQRRPEPRDPNQPDSLFEPVDTTKGYGAHGAFNDRSTNRSYEVWVAEHKTMLAGAVAGVAGLAAAALALTARQGG